MWLIKVFGVIYLAATCAAQGPEDAVTSFSATVFERELMPTPTPYVPPVPSLKLQSAWPDVFPSEKVELSCTISDSSDWTITWHRNEDQIQATDTNVAFSAEGSVLTITAATPLYSGSYSCTGHHKTKGVPTKSNTLQVKVHANKPKLTVSRKPNHDKMFTGESVAFTCAVDVSSEWEYVWYHDGNEIAAANTSTYTVDSLGLSNSGQYRCKARRGKSPFYTDDSETKSLQVSAPPTPSLKLLSPWPDVFEEEIVEFKCEVPEDGFDWTYTWYKDQNELKDVVDDEEMPFVNITVLSQVDQGTYACKVHLKPRRVSSGFSNSVDVTVYENTPEPTVSKGPDIYPMYVGETVKFTCDVSVSSGWNYQWFKDENQIPVGSSKTISIALSLSDGGKYFCLGTRGPATLTNRSAELHQDVHEIPVPSLNRMSQWSDVFPTESVKLSCGVQQGSGWTYTWNKNGQKIQADETVSFVSNEAFIRSASAKHAGQYTCKGHLQDRAVNSNSSSELTLTVYGEGPTVTLTQDPEYKVMFPTESVSFSCHINVSSGWEYEWYKDGTKLGESGYKYSVSSVGTANKGSYKCVAKRGKDQVFSTFSNRAIHLDIAEKKPMPLITREPNADKVYAGESVSFTCKVEISSGWEYLWYKGETPLPYNSSSFQIHAASLLDDGTYKCMAKREKSAYRTEHSAGRILQISEIPVPSLKKKTQWLDVFPTESVKLSCGIEGSSDWRYTWYRGGVKVPDNTVSFDADGATLSIGSASASHRGGYRCLGELKSRPLSSNLSTELTLRVYDRKPKVALIQTPDHDIWHTGDSVSFICHINVSSGWEYLWFKDGTPVGTSDKHYNITSAETTNTGSYTCQVKRGTGFHSDQSQAVRLNVENRPQANIVLLTGWSEVFATDSLVLKCEVLESQDKWDYIWLKEGNLINLPPSERYTVTPQDDPEQSLYTCRGNRSGRPSFSRDSDPFKTKNLLLKRRVLLSISGCLFFGLVAVFLGCIFLRFTRKPAADDDKPEEDNLFLTMAQLKDRNDAPCPLVEYITDASLNESSKGGDENGTVCSETTPLPITTQDDQAATTEDHDTEENNGVMVSFKQ